MSGPVGRALAVAGVLLLAVAPTGARANPPEIRRVVSGSGVEAWLVHDRAVPVIAVELAFRGGSATDPAGEEGLAHMVSALLDEGAGDLDADAFQRRLEDLAVRLRFDAGRDWFEGSLQTLRANRKAAFELLGLALTRPRFDDAAVERIRSQLLAVLARKAEDPEDLANRRLFAAVFAGHAYARPPEGTPDSVKAIAREDLRAFVTRRFSRDNLIVGVAGDITEEELAPLLDLAFGGLPAHTDPPEVAETQPLASGRTIVVEMAIPQSVAVFGGAGVKRNDPDYYAALVMNAVLGGSGFGSRLNEEVRQKRGLAYSVYSDLLPLDRAGLLLGGVATRNAHIRESLDLIRREWRRMKQGDVGEEEVNDAKTYLTGSFPLTLDGTDRIAGVLVAIQVYDLGIDYLERRKSLIEAVAVEDVRRVAGRLLEPDSLTFVVVGKPDGIPGEKERA